MLEEMKFAPLLQKVSTLDPTTGDPWDILDMATREGALGLADVTGTLEVGKDADIVTVDLGHPFRARAPRGRLQRPPTSCSPRRPMTCATCGCRAGASSKPAVISVDVASVASCPGGRGAVRTPAQPPGAHRQPGDGPAQERAGAMIATLHTDDATAEGSTR